VLNSGGVDGNERTTRLDNFQYPETVWTQQSINKESAGEIERVVKPEHAESKPETLLRAVKLREKASRFCLDRHRTHHSDVFRLAIRARSGSKSTK
jgi:hypothetical protein